MKKGLMISRKKEYQRRVPVRKVSEGVRRSFWEEASSSSPMQVAEVILSAIKSEKPHTRYLVGNDAVAVMERRKNSSDFELDRRMKESLLGSRKMRRVPNQNPRF